MRRAVRAAAWAALAVGCEQPRTELVARVDSEVAWGAGRTVQSVTLTVRRGGSAGPLRDVRTTVLGTDRGLQVLPLFVGILPGDDTDTPVWIEALGCPTAARCARSEAVVAQRAVVRFTRGQTEEVPLLLASACVGVTCRSDERCGEDGRCEPATRATVRPFDGSDAGTAADVAGGLDRVIVADVPVTDVPAYGRGLRRRGSMRVGRPVGAKERRDRQATDRFGIVRQVASISALAKGRPRAGSQIPSEAVDRDARGDPSPIDAQPVRGCHRPPCTQAPRIRSSTRTAASS